MLVLRMLRTWVGNVKSVKKSSSKTLVKSTLYLPGQKGIQVLLVIISVCMVPVMLFVKPLYLKKQHAQKARSGTQLAEGGGEAGEEKFEFGETMILQVLLN